eukprot:TRINITY_DN60923_c0_g1_i1.p1 TRINITY_DN60923_c0_g1~~TRINITY_DN60923_c0_g1_i1.p1  ORF type:complete len:388 (+),score=90.48 TRINITY_DN60923_c0_g1_i1:91-1254(+)
MPRTPRTRELCLPCAAVAALALAACRLYGMLAPLRSPQGRCKPSQATLEHAQCRPGDIGRDPWVSHLPAVDMLTDGGVRHSCSIDILADSNQSCVATLEGWFANAKCDLTAPQGSKKVCQMCWYHPWRKDGETISGLLFGRARVDGCDIAGDDSDSWSASVLYLLVAGALASYLIAFCCRCGRADADTVPLLGPRWAGDESENGDEPRGVVEPASGSLADFYPAGTPHGRHCSICMDKQLCVVLEPCMHLATCADCATSVRTCPICRNPISRRLQIEVRDYQFGQSPASSGSALSAASEEGARSSQQSEPRFLPLLGQPPAPLPHGPAGTPPERRDQDGAPQQPAAPPGSPPTRPASLGEPASPPAPGGWGGGGGSPSPPAPDAPEV